MNEKKQISIVKEKMSQIQDIYTINAAAFETEAEAKLVNALRDSCPGLISLVAAEEGVPVGHILFSPMMTKDGKPTRVMGLAPMAVLPAYQKKGIGSLLIKAGLEACREAGWQGVVVLGHPDYYPRFGFRPSVCWGIRSEYDVPDEVFMALELTVGGLEPLRGATLIYHPSFQNV